MLYVIMCMYCKCKTTIPSLTTHVVNYKDCIIIIKNVPCEECEQCGEKYYSDEVAEQVESLVNMAKQLMCNAALYSRRKKHFIFGSINTITAISFR